MAQVSSIFSQILGLVPRRLFDAAVARHGGMRHARGFSCWDQFVAMLFCQLGQAHSLREIREGLQACEGKLVHLGMTQAPSHSTLAYANEHRSWEIYQNLFLTLVEHLRQQLPGAGGNPLKLPGKVGWGRAVRHLRVGETRSAGRSVLKTRCFDREAAKRRTWRGTVKPGVPPKC